MTSPKDNLIKFIKGFILGLANVIPGVSGGTIAVTLGLYEEILSCVSNFFKNIKKNFNALLPIILGILVSLITTSKLVTYALTNFKAQTVFLFVGLIFGGISLIMRKTRGKANIKNMIIFFIMFFIVIGISYLKKGMIVISFNNMMIIDYLLLIIIGFIASSAMVVPGISGSFILMVFGYYDKIIATVSDITNFANIKSNLCILIPFGVGVLIGIIFMAKLITSLIKKHDTPTYFAILGFVLSSIVILLLQIDSFKFNFSNIITCIIFFCWGYILARTIEKE